MSREVHVQFCEGLAGQFRRSTHLVILLRSERVATRVLKGLTTHIGEVLGLPVNESKSGVAATKKVTFLGFQILAGKIRISNKARTNSYQIDKKNNTAVVTYGIKKELTDPYGSAFISTGDFDSLSKYRVQRKIDLKKNDKGWRIEGEEHDAR